MGLDLLFFKRRIEKIRITRNMRTNSTRGANWRIALGSLKVIILFSKSFVVVIDPWFAVTRIFQWPSVSLSGTVASTYDCSPGRIVRLAKLIGPTCRSVNWALSNWTFPSSSIGVAPEFLKKTRITCPLASDLPMTSTIENFVCIWSAVPTPRKTGVAIRAFWGRLKAAVLAACVLLAVAKRNASCELTGVDSGIV